MCMDRQASLVVLQRMDQVLAAMLSKVINLQKYCSGLTKNGAAHQDLISHALVQAGS